MENQMNVGDQNTQQIGKNPVSQPVITPEKPKTNYLMIGGIVLACFVVFGFGGLYLGKQSSNPQSYSSNVQNQSNPSATPETSFPTTSLTSAQQIVLLPSGWSYKDNGKCGVKFAIPPKTAPYLESSSTRFWDFPRGGVFPNMLSKLPSWDDKNFDIQANTMFASEQEASGYVASAVSVSCISNGANLNNKTMLDALKNGIQQHNQNTGEKAMQADTYTISSSKEVSRWGHSVLDLSIVENFGNSGGQPFTRTVQYTMFTTPQYINEIKVFGELDNTFVKETANKIFDNLSFQ